jgi:hypothetical protein
MGGSGNEPSIPPAVTYGFINFPEPDHPHIFHGPNVPDSGLADSGEGGTEFYLMVFDAAWSQYRERQESTWHPASVRDLCVTGFRCSIEEWDAVPDDEFQARWGAHQRYMHESSIEEQKRRSRPGSVYTARRFFPLPVESVVCIGASTRSLWDYSTGSYWKPTYDELTEPGQQLYDSLSWLYGFGTVQIVVVLDT